MVACHAAAHNSAVLAFRASQRMLVSVTSLISMVNPMLSRAALASVRIAKLGWSPVPSAPMMISEVSFAPSGAAVSLPSYTV